MTKTPQRVAQTSLKTRVLHSGGWSLVGFFFGHGIRFGGNLVMTRLLVPEMFGVMAIASLVLVGLAMFSDLGLRQSAVQSKRGEEAPFLNTVWIVQIVRGFLLWFIACILSVIIALANSHGFVQPGSVYSSADLPYVIAVASFGVAISGFESTKVYEASRQLSLSRLTAIEIFIQLAAFLCMLAWAIVDRTIWALVAGSIISYLLRAILTHTHLNGTRNRWQWDSAAFKEIVSYGKWVFASSILGFLVKNGDRILLGALVNAATLGVYAIAYLIYEAIEQLFSRILVNVSFPALSEIARERRDDLKKTYYKFHLPIASLAYFISGMLVTAGPALIDVLYDDRYRDAGWILGILAISITSIPLRLSEQSFLALGIPRLLSNITTMHLFAIYTFVPFGFYSLGLEGALWGVVLGHFSRWPLIIYYGNKMKLLDLRKELIVLPLIPAGALMGYLIKLVVDRYA
jgi:O-antigen/teichoic acid export membrane protein